MAECDYCSARHSIELEKNLLVGDIISMAVTYQWIRKIALGYDC